MSDKKMPEKKGWYWVKTYNKKMPCWYMSDIKCFLPAGLGDPSSMGLFEDDIKEVGPEIIEPEF